MGNLNRVVYLTQEDYDTLRAEGSVTKNGKTLTFNQNDLYVTSSTSVVPLSNSAANWAVNTTFYPKEGEIIIYEADANNPIPRIKIGDGAHLVKDLPFATAIYLDATQNNSGLMSATDKTKLDGLPGEAAVPSSVAIVANSNTHAAITSRQYVYVRGHSTLAEGLYQATANIAQNAALSTSNLTAVSGGGLNALNSNITVTSVKSQVTFNLSDDRARSRINKIGKMVVAQLQIGDWSTGTGDIVTLPSSLSPTAPCGIYINIFNITTGGYMGEARVHINPGDTVLKYYNCTGTFNTNSVAVFELIWFVA